MKKTGLYSESDDVVVLTLVYENLYCLKNLSE
jgi:hypothetical protein